MFIHTRAETDMKMHIPMHDVDIQHISATLNSLGVLGINRSRELRNGF